MIRTRTGAFVRCFFAGGSSISTAARAALPSSVAS